MNDDLIGKKVGRLTVLNEDINRPKKYYEWKGKKYPYVYYRCLCECGKFVSIRKNLLGNSKITTKSCGCLISDVITTINKKRKFSDKDRTLNAQYRLYKYRAKKRNLVFDFTKAEFSNFMLEKCYYCGWKSETKPHFHNWKSRDGFLIYNGLDRIDSTKGYTRENVVPCCRSCNSAKLNLTQQEFFHLISMIYNTHKSRMD
jgi:hypothetical protein